MSDYALFVFNEFKSSTISMITSLYIKMLIHLAITSLLYITNSTLFKGFCTINVFNAALHRLHIIHGIHGHYMDIIREGRKPKAFIST